jgi:hypothetical protein
MVCVHSHTMQSVSYQDPFARCLPLQKQQPRDLTARGCCIFPGMFAGVDEAVRI